MKQILLAAVGVSLALVGSAAKALGQTAGTAKMEVTINDYTGTSGTAHYAVAWVTTESGTFIKSLRKQGPSSWTSSQWGDHCGTWNTARAGSTSLDGYTSATAANYTGNNSPVIQSWNGTNANNTALMPDGNYKFWVQYAENAGQGPVTTAGLLWTKGPNASTNTYANQGANFTNMKVTWTPVPVNVEPASIGSVGLSGNDLIFSGQGPANGTFSVLVSTNAATPDPGQWTAIATRTFDAAGQFRFTNTISPSVPQQYYRLRVP